MNTQRVSVHESGCLVFMKPSVGGGAGLDAGWSMSPPWGSERRCRGARSLPLAGNHIDQLDVYLLGKVSALFRDLQSPSSLSPNR